MASLLVALMEKTRDNLPIGPLVSNLNQFGVFFAAEPRRQSPRGSGFFFLFGCPILDLFHDMATQF